MKKRNVVVIVLIIALLLMGSAYAAWTDSVSVTVNADSATLNVKIVERTSATVTSASGSTYEHSTIGTPTPATIVSTVGTETVTEDITNMVPGETVTFVYRIENLGTLDVDLTGVTVNHTLTTLPLNVTWTVQQYDSSDVLEGSDTGSGTDTAFTNIDLVDVGDYCVLTLEVAIDESSGTVGPFETVQSGSLTVSLDYTQK